jgi:DNA (cytosine-5)-methyltransferase 1
MQHQVIIEKINRIRDGKTPSVLDLFAGCGGLSLGFKRAGYEIGAFIEIDEHACKTHTENFYKNISEDVKNNHSRPKDITEYEPENLLNEFSFDDNPEKIIDVIIGGPPCQSFARVGRAKLREVFEHPFAFLRDPRSNLYLRYIHYVKKLQPVAILIENVPDVINYGGHNIANEIAEVLDDLGYYVKYTILNSVFYGVPQMRERMFLIALSKQIQADVFFPSPTHWIDLPQGYLSSRQVALQTIRNNLFERDLYYTSPPYESTDHLEPAITAEQALGDLPVITKHLEGKMKRGARHLNEFTAYRETAELSEYAKSMRNWPEFESNSGIYDHVIRSLPRDYKIFRRMKPGDQYPEAFEHAIQMFNEHLSNLRKQGLIIKEDSIKYQEEKAKWVPPYDPRKFPNKWRKMERDKPARTLMAHLGKDGYSHIHYDSDQARTISVREAARLQSFPDGFIFSGTMNPAFRQIGNAVPPLMSFALAKHMLEKIRGKQNGR